MRGALLTGLPASCPAAWGVPRTAGARALPARGHEAWPGHPRASKAPGGKEKAAIHVREGWGSALPDTSERAAAPAETPAASLSEISRL